MKMFARDVMSLLECPQQELSLRLSAKTWLLTQLFSPWLTQSQKLDQRLSRNGDQIALFAERDGWQAASGLNHRLRVLHYGDGDKDQFEPHYDLSVVEPESQRHSLITVLLYLNSNGVDFDGGETLFLDPLDEQAPGTAVTPAVGRVMLFEHALYHSGAPLADIGGHKYVLRTDVMFNQNKVPGYVETPVHCQPAPQVDTLVALLDKLELKSPAQVGEALKGLGLLECTLKSFRGPGRGTVAAMLLEYEIDTEDIDLLCDAAFAI